MAERHTVGLSEFWVDRLIRETQDSMGVSAEITPPLTVQEQVLRGAYYLALASDIPSTARDEVLLRLGQLIELVRKAKENPSHSPEAPDKPIYADSLVSIPFDPQLRNPRDPGT